NHLAAPDIRAPTEGIMKSKKQWQSVRQGSGFVCFVLIMLTAAGLAAADTDYKIDRGLMITLTEDADATAPFFVVFGDRADVKPAHRIASWEARGRFVVQSLHGVANRSQGRVRGYLQSRRVAFTPFWIENKIYVREGTLELARALAQYPEVAALLPEVIYTIPPPSTDAGTQSIEWNISKIRADQVWPTTRGNGTVVANIDTGVQYNHPAVVAQYRGNVGGVFTHAGNWKDPSGICGLTPCDNNGHGTHTMGTMVGDDGATNKIGVAPGARWIACKGCATNSCSSSHLTICAQWILDPHENGSGTDRPHAVNNSWGGGGGDNWYLSYVQNWRAAGVFPAFSAGNSGPSCATAGSPGDYAESFASGATTINDAIASFSSRGPSSFGGIKPNVSAPGSGVRSSVPTNSYSSLSGTSMASPHTAGTVALVWASAPSLLGNIASTEQLLKNTALPLGTTQTCGGIAAGATPNNTFGWGRLDALAAVQGAGTPVNQPPTVTITGPTAGASFACPATVNFTGTASDPDDGNLTGAISWSEGGSNFGTGGSASKSYSCAEAGNHIITASVADTKGATDTDTITITIVNTNLPAAPTNLTATVNGAVVNLAWTDNSGDETGFKVERKKKGSPLWGVIVTTGANATTYADSPGKGNWDYRVRAVNAAGESDPSNVVTARVR
ncbi:MAG: S8 family serine peptidase, partial [Gammaproteobacteria bacterium]